MFLPCTRSPQKAVLKGRLSHLPLRFKFLGDIVDPCLTYLAYRIPSYAEDSLEIIRRVCFTGDGVQNREEGQQEAVQEETKGLPYAREKAAVLLN